MPEGDIDYEETLDALIELHPFTCVWVTAITERRCFVEGKTDDPMLLGEVLPHYGHPMEAQVSCETDLTLSRSGPLREDFNLWAAGLLAKFSSQQSGDSCLNIIGAKTSGGSDAPLTVTSENDNEELDPVPVQNVVVPPANTPEIAPGGSKTGGFLDGGGGGEGGTVQASPTVVSLLDDKFSKFAAMVRLLFTVPVLDATENVLRLDPPHPY